MYAALWRVLRGGRRAKIAQLVVLLTLVVVVLFAWVFPWIDGLVQYAEPTLGA